MKSPRVGPPKISKALLRSDTKKKKRIEAEVFEVKKKKKIGAVAEFAVEKKPAPKGELIGKRKLKALKEEPTTKKKKGTSKKQQKKMDRMSTQLALLGNVTPRQVEKTLAENFGDAAPKIIDMLEMNDNDGAMILLQKRLLQSSIAMLTYAEKALRDSEGVKGTYQYATLVSQIRELITDIQAGRDRSFIANSIIDQSIRPAFMDIAEFILNDHQSFRKEMQEQGVIKKDMQPEFNTALRDLAKKLAAKMHDKYKGLSFNITQQLTS